jgi:pre-peptidase/flagellar hook capping protein FlgD
VEAEANDLPATATPIELGVTAIGAFSSTADADWYSFTGTAGQTVQFFLAPAEGSEADGFLRLFCRNGDISDRLAYSYFGGGQAYVVFTLPADGTYLVRALPINTSAGIGNYYLFTGIHYPNRLDVARDSRDVMLSHSNDGIHWTRRALVNHDPAHFDNTFPEVAVDGRGDVHLVWYDHRNDAECGILTDLYYSRLRSGDDSFSADQQVNDGPATNWNLIPSRLAPNMGDYIALTADGGTVYANWADGRLGSPDSWMSAITGGVRGRDENASLQPSPSEAALSVGGSAGLEVGNPVRFGTPIALSFALSRAGDARLEIYSITGQRVRSLLAGTVSAGAQRLTWDARGRDGATVAPGVYFAVLETADGRFARRMVLLK